MRENARAKNNCKDLAIFAKKVGSNYFLKDKRLEFYPSNPSAALAAGGGAASASNSDLFLCQGQDSNLGSLAARVLQTRAFDHSATLAFISIQGIKRYLF